MVLSLSPSASSSSPFPSPFDLSFSLKSASVVDWVDNKVDPGEHEPVRVFRVDGRLVLLD